MEEDKNDIVGRKDGKQDDHMNKRLVLLLGDSHKETVN